MVLPLNSIEVRNFRGLNDLSIGTLGRVNLFVGKNNVGKTSLLEAVQIWATRGSVRTLWDILDSRAEVSRRDSLDGTTVELLFNRSGVEDGLRHMSVGPVGRPDARVTLGLGWTTWQEGDDGSLTRVVVKDPESASQTRAVEESLVVTVFGYPPRLVPLERLRMIPRMSERGDRPDKSAPIPATFVPANGFSEGAIGPLWDGVALTDAEADVLAGLNIIAPDLERLTLVGGATSFRARTMMARTRGQNAPVPLKSLGAGVNRMLGITLSLVNARGGVALMDEIENGIHYSVQGDLWRLVLRMARRLDLQVFATSHSWDCVRAFQAATAEDDEADGVLVRIEAKAGKIRAVPFDEKELTIATLHDIEVR